MKCPKCKTEVTAKDTFCPGCNLRLIIECPKCKSKVRLGSASCKSCGYVFVKFCPKCNSANYVSSPTCRKCFYVFEDIKEEDKKETKNSEQILLKQENKTPPKNLDTRAKGLFNGDGRLEFLVDFINLQELFKKYKNDDFKNKVLLNITTSIKVAFGATAEFYKENVARFKVNYNKNNGICEKLNKFNNEISKFNNVLKETLGAEITFKTVILTAGEIEPDKPVMQLAIGQKGDVITSKSTYDILSDEIPLIKISPDSYKMASLEKETKQSGSIKETDETSAIELIYKTVTTENNIKGISINAPRGTGKSHLLNQIYDRLENDDIAVLAARCSAMSQVAPMGLFQDAFLNLFSLPFAPVDYNSTVSNLRELLIKHLPKNFENEKIDTLINLIYPINQDFYEKLQENQNKTFSHIKDILEALRLNTKLLIAVDDFDLIDEMSFEFLKYLIENNFFSDGSRFLICYRNQNSLNMYIPQEVLPAENCLDISLKKREIGSVRVFIKKYLGDVSILPRKISDQIIMNSKGDLAYTGQVLYHLTETSRIKFENDKFVYDPKEEEYFVPKTMADIVASRLSFLYKESKSAFVILNLASFLGGKFTKSVIQDVIDTDDEELETIFTGLIQGGYITKIDDENYLFKNSLLWTNIYICAKNNPELKPYIEATLQVLQKRKVSSPAICALLAQAIKNKEYAFKLWTNNLKIASAIGDCALYIMSQKQSLINLEDLDIDNKEYIKNNIYERLGKLTYKKNPPQAVEYLSNSVIEAKNEDNIPKVIELSGYLVESCKLSQKYTAVIETVDNLLSLFKGAKFELQRALIKTRKLNALLNTGNYEEIINTVNNEINPVLSDAIRNKKKVPYISKDDLYTSWIDSNIILVEAYAYQGNPVAFELVEVVEKEIYKDSKKINKHISMKLQLACALCYTMKGILNQSDEILHNLIKEFTNTGEDSFLISKWNMITLFNKILRMDNENIKEDLFEAVTYANNIGDFLVKNILKTLLAYVIIEENDPLKALEICKEQMNYFSNEKVALGALIAWYISARATLKISGAPKAIEICEKSIQIAKNPKINTIWFKVLFQLLLAKCYIIKNDLESAKMYVELASQDVNQNELNYFMVLVVRMRAIIMRESIDTINEDKKAECAVAAKKMFEKAINLSSKLDLTKLNEIIKKELISLIASSKLKRINIDE